MGLDNGITLRTRKTLDPPSWVHIDEITVLEQVRTYEICYWRKCHNIRAEIIDVIGESVDVTYELSIPELKDIQRKLIKLIKDGGDAWSDCRWSYDEMLPSLAQDIANITWLIEYLKSDRTAYVYFYDSY